MPLALAQLLSPIYRLLRTWQLLPSRIYRRASLHCSGHRSVPPSRQASRKASLQFSTKRTLIAVSVEGGRGEGREGEGEIQALFQEGLDGWQQDSDDCPLLPLSPSLSCSHSSQPPAGLRQVSSNIRGSDACGCSATPNKSGRGISPGV